jgi:hypothetical protein
LTSGLFQTKSQKKSYAKLVKHLKKHGFSDLKVIQHGSTEPSRTPINDPFVGLLQKPPRRFMVKRL